MNRLLPMPWISLGLLIAWPLLMGDLSVLVGLGAVLTALTLPWLARHLQPDADSAARPVAIIRLTGIVLWDILVSNVVVARLVLGPVSALRPAFVEVPVGTDHPLVLNLLASIITMTPGTVSATVETDPVQATGMILVHALNCDDPASLSAEIKARYEQPLLEIFGCSSSL